VEDCRITRVDVHDVRFPTSRTLAGSDAMNQAPDYSAAYVIPAEIVVAAVHALAHLVEGCRLSDIAADQRGFWRGLTGDSHLRWIGPEKGVVHLTTAALVNAVWDLWARAEGKPVWKLLVDMSPEELVGCIDFRYLTDALTPEQAVELLESRSQGKAKREGEMRRDGFPAYTTSVGWLGFTDGEVQSRCRAAVGQGWTHPKMKVGGDLESDARRAALIRQEIGSERFLMMDANQVWEVEEAIAATRRLAEFDPWWMEEPTSPDDILGHARIAREVAPVRVATGEHCHNRTIVGLSEYVQHLSLVDYIAIGGDLHDRVIEYVDELHEHFVDPVVIRDGRYQAPEAPGYSIEMHSESLEEYAFPGGRAWR
jgi:L-fuconate dehydratase